jgi:hypothetical protein
LHRKVRRDFHLSGCGRYTTPLAGTGPNFQPHRTPGGRSWQKTAVDRSPASGAGPRASRSARDAHW